MRTSSAYQSFILGSEDEDEIDTGFRQALDIMITLVDYVYFPKAFRRRQSPQSGMIKYSFSIVYVTFRYDIFSFSVRSDFAA